MTRPMKINAIPTIGVVNRLSKPWAALDGATSSRAAFLDGKIRACRYFFRWELPRIRPQAALLQSLDQTCAEMPVDSFG